MSSGMFAVVCPGCGAEMSLDTDGRHTCLNCPTVYVNRLGYLVEVTEPEALVEQEVASS